MFINIKLKVIIHFFNGCTNFPCAPTSFATYLPSGKKKCLARSEERTLTTLTQELCIYLSAEKLKSDDWCFIYVLFPLALESKKQNTAKG